MAGLTVLASVLALAGVGPATGREVPMEVAKAVPPDTATITIVGGFTPQFSPQQVSIAPGGTLTVVNPTSSPHTFTSAAVGSDGKPLFNLHLDPGQTRTMQVALTDGTYHFLCLIHSNMTGTLTVGAGGPVVELPPFEQPLAQPPRLTGRHVTIVMKRALVRVLPHGPRTPMWTYGGTFPGPTIVRRAGQDIKVTYVNRLPTRVGAVTVHQHGGHHASKDDGQPMDYLIRHGRSRTYDYPLRDAGKPVPAALRFYHDHRMDVTARNNWFGLQGMFLTIDPHDAQMGLPHGKFDLPLDFTDRTFRADNTLTNPFAAGMSMGGDAPMGTVGVQVLVNGRFAPYKRVLPGRYRLRLLNTSLFSSYDFALSDGRAFTQIGTGSGLLPQPVVRQDILLGPAQRADVVVDFRKESGKNVVLASIASTDPNGPGSRPAGLMQFRVRGTTTQRARIPSTLAHIAALRLPSKIAKTWTFGLTKTSGGKLLVDQRQAVRPETSRPPGGPRARREVAAPQHLRHDPLRPPPRGGVAHDPARREAAAALGARLRGRVAARPGRERRGGREVHRLHRRLHDPLPHARPRGRRHDGHVPRRPALGRPALGRTALGRTADVPEA